MITKENPIVEITEDMMDAAVSIQDEPWYECRSDNDCGCFVPMDDLRWHNGKFICSFCFCALVDKIESDWGDSVSLGDVLCQGNTDWKFVLMPAVSIEDLAKAWEWSESRLLQYCNSWQPPIVLWTFSDGTTAIPLMDANMIDKQLRWGSYIDRDHRGVVIPPRPMNSHWLLNTLDQIHIKVPRQYIMEKNVKQENLHRMP